MDMLRLMFLLKPGGGLVPKGFVHISSAGEAGFCVDHVDLDTGGFPQPRSELLRPKKD